MITIDRDELVLRKGNVEIPNILFTSDEILNYDLLVDAILDLFISFNKKKIEVNNNV